MKLLTFLTIILLFGCGANPVSSSSSSSLEFASIEEYNRYSWGYWKDEDKDCQDTRQEILISKSLSPITYETEKKCRVKTGKWYGLYTNNMYTDPSMLDIDHIVPLKEVHFSGGMNWQRNKKHKYFNDMNGLLPVYKGANRSKGARQPHEWLPQNRAFVCSYIKKWVEVKHEWNLILDCEEAKGIINLYNKYCR